MENCNCSYCYHNVCFHPSRGDGAGLGVMCDGCDIEEEQPLTEFIPESSEQS